MWKIFLGLIVIVVVVFAWQSLQAESYYRGVYESCVRTSILANRTTSFDLLACSELEQRARRENWFEHRVVISQ